MARFFIVLKDGCEDLVRETFSGDSLDDVLRSQEFIDFLEEAEVLEAGEEDVILYPVQYVAFDIDRQQVVIGTQKTYKPRWVCD